MKYVNEQGEPMAFSEIENVYPRNYEDLCVFLRVEPNGAVRRKPIPSGDGKIYDFEIGKIVWANVVASKRPIHNDKTPIAESIYQLLGELGSNGDFPAMLYLYDRLDISESEYLSVCKDKADERSPIFRWAKEVFSHTSKINAVHGNGNVSVFQYVSMSDGTDDGGNNAYITPEQNINSILALFGELAANKGKVGENDEPDV